MSNLPLSVGLCVCALRIGAFDISIFMVSAFSRYEEKARLQSHPFRLIRLAIQPHTIKKNSPKYGICIEQIVFLPILMAPNHPRHDVIA